eukprot:symbB.v1.2.012995.t1/scaffold912.1/size152940/1
MRSTRDEKSPTGFVLDSYGHIPDNFALGLQKTRLASPREADVTCTSVMTSECGG